jgi:hypothetical protein
MLDYFLTMKDVFSYPARRRFTILIHREDGTGVPAGLQNQ